jgi:hypothetical protein
VAQLGFVPSNKDLRSIPASVFDALTSQCLLNCDATSPGPEFGPLRESVRRNALAIVERFAAGGGPDCLPVGTNILVFGSSGNGFGAPNSDLDMCLALPAGTQLPDPPASMGRVSLGPVFVPPYRPPPPPNPPPTPQLAEKLEQAGMLEVNARLTARIPIVMFKDPVSGLECDISMTNPLAIKNTKLLATYARADPRVRVLAYAIKRWAKARNLNSPSNGTLSSYGWVLLMLHVLMRVRLIPNLQTLPPDWTGADQEGATGPGGREDIPHPTEPDFVVNGCVRAKRAERAQRRASAAQSLLSCSRSGREKRASAPTTDSNNHLARTRPSPSPPPPPPPPPRRPPPQLHLHAAHQQRNGAAARVLQEEHDEHRAPPRRLLQVRLPPPTPPPPYPPYPNPT